MESYVFEKGLLSDEDLQLYNLLSDKFNQTLIDDVIKRCKERLKQVICEGQLFDTQIFFKMKKYNEEDDVVSFRPIHTANLIDQICMVCMLNLIMFDNNKADERIKSDISKLLPHNFYGNIPSTKYEHLFWPWKMKYKEYSETTINKYREYKHSKQYSCMISLDLMDFYPSINPGYIYEYIFNNLKVIYDDPYDLECLKVVITRLLFFKISQDNLDGWQDVYYPNNDVENNCSYYFCRGIPQGLPQSYFFGNLYMIRVSEIVDKHIPGDSYYYVDDSVVFSNKLDKEFNQVIDEMNEDLKESFVSGADYLNYLPIEYQKIMGKVNYQVKFHKEGKSTIVNLDDTHDYAGGFMMIAAQVSKAAVFYDNLEEIDDNMSLEKLNSLVKAIDNELSYLKTNNQSSNDYKMLQRYRRFFLFRERLLELRNTEDSFSQEIIDRFNNLYQVKQKKIDYKELFIKFEEEIFQGESHLMLQTMDAKRGEEFYDDMVKYELNIAIHNNRHRKRTYLYYHHDFLNTLKLKKYSSHRYDSLSSYLCTVYSGYTQSKFEVKLKVLTPLSRFPNKIMYYKPASNVMRYSNEYTRQKLNALFSYLFNVDINDRPIFFKYNNRAINYMELRSLAFLRNSLFEKDKFTQFFKEIKTESKKPYGETSIDSRIFEVLALFIKQVRCPFKVDNLILTHRLVNGLWKNGSKFLNAYTLHNEEHAIALIRESMHLLKVFDDLGLKRNDYYVLFLACYLHDISMVVHPDLSLFKKSTINTNEIVTECLTYVQDTLGPKNKLLAGYKQVLLHVYNAVFNYFENEIRSNHPTDSAAFIKKHHDNFLAFIDDSIIQTVADVSEAHGYDADDVYGIRSWAKSDLYSEKYLKILLRLADLMDMSKDRVNYYLLRENVRNMEPASKFHWISHLITDDSDVYANYKVHPNKRIYERPIEEEITVNIHLNTHYNVKFEKRKPCEKCNVDAKKMKNELIIHLTDTRCASHGNCSLMCVWMQVKNNYLINELNALQDYLDKLESSIFLPSIKIVIHTENRTNLDEDFFDEVREYLKKKDDE